MIDALDRQMVPLEKELRAYARRQAGCKALMAYYGIGELCAVTILAELGDRQRSATPEWTSPATSQTSAERPVTSRVRDRLVLLREWLVIERCVVEGHDDDVGSEVEKPQASAASSSENASTR